MTGIDHNVTAASFRRNYAQGAKTKLFEDFPATVQEQLCRAAALADDEEPIFAWFDDVADWFLVTTQRLIHTEDGRMRELPILEFEWVDVDMENNFAQGIAKDQWRELTIRTTDGDSFTITVEPGGPFFGMWNTLRWVAHWAGTQREETTTG